MKSEHELHDYNTTAGNKHLALAEVSNTYPI
jgi:hypothetical protein